MEDTHERRGSLLMYPLEQILSLRISTYKYRNHGKDSSLFNHELV